MVTNCTKIRLQLGHAGEGVEIMPVLPCADLFALLQLGHAGEGVEITAAPTEEKTEAPASIGPRR